VVKTKRVRAAQALLVVVVTAALVVGTYYFLERSNQDPIAFHEAEPEPVTEAQKSGAALREELLHASAAKLKLTPERGVWGVLMERGYAKGVATFVALVDGTASLYTSSGGAAVGGKAYTPARAAALKLVARAADALAATSPAKDFPKPAAGRVRFYVLAEGGVRTAEVDAAPGHADGGAEGPLAAQLAAGDELVAGLQEATSKGIVR
jgi:hypothetical protein